MTKSSKIIRDQTFYPVIITNKESLSSNEIGEEIDISLLDKIKKRLGNKCSKDGYIEEKSIKLIERSIGRINTAHFTGDIIFDIKLEVKCCNPMEGDILECEVMGKNKMGIICHSFPLLIALSKIHHKDKIDKFDKINIGERIKVEVLCSKFELNDTEINVIARLHED